MIIFFPYWWLSYNKLFYLLRAGNAVAQPEVLFTYPSLMGDYDKIRRPSLQDGCLTRFSPLDDPVQLTYSLSVAIQLPQPDRRTAGVTRLGPDGCFL